MKLKQTILLFIFIISIVSIASISMSQHEAPAGAAETPSAAEGAVAPAETHPAPEAVAPVEGHEGGHEAPVGETTTHGAEAAEGGHGGESGGAHGGGHGGVPTIFYFMIVNFIIFAAALYMALRKPVAAAIRDRSKNIAKEMQDSATLLENAEKRHADVQSRLDRLEAEIADLKDMMRKEGEAQGLRVIERSEGIAEKIREDAKFQADQQVKLARQTLQAEAARLAVHTAEEILKKSVTDDDHKKLVGRFLKEVKES